METEKLSGRARKQLEPRFMKHADRTFFREHFKGPKNLDWFLTFNCGFIRDGLPGCASLANETVRASGEILFRAVLDKLARQFPKTAPRGDAVLLETHPDRAANLLNHAFCHALDLWTKEYKANPAGSADERLARLAPALRHLPSGRRSPLGDTILFVCFADDYEKAKQALPQLSPGKRQARWRVEKLFNKRFTEAEWSELRCLKRSDLALEFARRSVGNRHGVKIDQARKLRRKALRFVRALPSAPLT